MKVKYEFHKSKTRGEVEVRVKGEDGTILPTDVQFEQLQKAGVQSEAARCAERMGIAGAGIRDKSYKVYDKEGKLLKSRQDPDIAIVGLLYQFDTVL